MRHARWTRLAGALALAGVLTACNDFLSGPELTTDPNNPSTAEIEQLFHGVQLNTFFWQTGNLARVISMWTNQMAGTDRQYLSLDAYDFGKEEFDGEFNGVYIAGGLVDMRKVQELAGNDRTYAGIARVYEALMMGTAASIWGALPYSEAVGDVATPVFDSQSAVYATVQTVLDAAIADLQSGTGAGPGFIDLVYGGDRTAWLQAAHTLKARFYMHWVEAQAAGVPGAAVACGQQSCLDQAIAAAANGISSPANDLKSWHTSTPGEQNMWYQFVYVFRPGYISAGKTLVDLLVARNDPRLPHYFDPVTGGQYVGAEPASEGNFSLLAAGGRGSASFQQPIVTYLEDELILAEARARQQSYGLARGHINAARASVGLGPTAAVDANLLQEAITEKYIAMFQNIEAWNDLKRSCAPAFTPPADELISRIFYSGDERNTNPNTPEESTVFDKNENDPVGCFM
jgi:starch-binding outer membrane protein, SusD/RagB family